MLPIQQCILSPGGKCRPGAVAVKKMIVIYETKSHTAGRDAGYYSRFLCNLARANTSYLSWHFTVDDSQIIQHIPVGEVAWHAGDGDGGDYNLHAVAIRICMDPLCDVKAALHNAALLTAYLVKKERIPFSGILRPGNWGLKSRPGILQDAGAWQAFLKDCAGEYAKLLSPATLPAGEAVPGAIVVVNGRGYKFDSAAGERTRSYVNEPMQVLGFDKESAAPFHLTELLSSGAQGYFTPPTVSLPCDGVRTPPRMRSEPLGIAPLWGSFVRQSPRGRIINWFLPGHPVEVLSAEDGWAKIAYGGCAAYLLSQNLKTM